MFLAKKKTLKRGLEASKDWKTKQYILNFDFIYIYDVTRCITNIDIDR
jgi:hypothetical protein